MINTCDYEEDPLHGCVLLRVDGEWITYKGSTSTRKLYYRAHEALRSNSSSFYVYDYEGKKVTGALFPNGFYNSLSCTSIDGVPSHALPHRILLVGKKKCNWIILGNGSGYKVCTYCGKGSVT